MRTPKKINLGAEKREDRMQKGNQWHHEVRNESTRKASPSSAECSSGGTSGVGTRSITGAKDVIHNRLGEEGLDIRASEHWYEGRKMETWEERKKCMPVINLVINTNEATSAHYP